jgi:hypothetical protein
VDGVDDAVFKMTRDFPPAAIGRAPDDQAMLGAGVKSNSFAHDFLLGSNRSKRFEPPERFEHPERI